MALQIWLPLNGDLHNQGLDNIEIENHNTIINSNGKIGKCYEFGQNKYIKLLNYSNTFTNYLSFSISLWFKCTAQNTSHTGSALISGGSWNQPNNLLNLALGTFSTDHYTQILISGAGTWNKGYNYNIYLNTWYHIVFTNGNGALRVYINGELIGDTYTAVMPGTLQQTWICIGNGTYAQSFHFYGLMNDIRIYDHCLSPKEVEKISQGLILHYQLNDFFPLNLVKYDKNIYTETDGSKWVRIFHHNNPASKLFSNTDTWALGVYKDADRWFDIYPIVQNLTTFEFMVKQKTTSAATEVKYRWIQNKSPLVATYNDVKPDAVTRITTSGYTNGNQGGLWRSGHANTHMVIANSNSGNWYGATGCWVAYQGGIPGYPNTVITTGYIDLYIKISNYISNSIYDCSGYQNNGITIGELTPVTNTPRYNIATHFAGNGNIIKMTPFYLNSSNWTISFWYYRSNVITNTWESFMCLSKDNGSDANKKIALLFNNANANNIWCKIDSGSARTIPVKLNQWTHLALTSNGKLYENGIDKNISITPGTILTNAYDLIIGGRASAAGATSTTLEYTGNISDFRIYATALSAAAIKELYLTSLDTSSGSPKARELE